MVVLFHFVLRSLPVVLRVTPGGAWEMHVDHVVQIMHSSPLSHLPRSLIPLNFDCLGGYLGQMLRNFCLVGRVTLLTNVVKVLGSAGSHLCDMVSANYCS